MSNSQPSRGNSKAGKVHNQDRKADSDAPIALASIDPDISGRKEAQAANPFNEERFRALIENSADAIALLDTAGTVIYDSPAAMGMLGYGREEWIGKSVFQLIHIDDLQQVQDLFQKLAETPGRHVKSVFRLRHKDNSWLWIEAVATNLLAEPAVQAIVVNYRDITERKQAEQKLHLSDQILQRVNTLVLVADSQGDIIYISPAVRIILGYEPEELLGDKWWKISRSESAEGQREKEYVGRAARGEIPIEDEAYERPIQDKSGNTHWISWVDAAGLGNTLIGVGHDITERKKAQQTLVESEALYRLAIETAGAVPYREVYPNVNEERVEYQFIGEGIRQITGYGPEEFNASLWENITLEMHPRADLAEYSTDEAIQRVRSGKDPLWKCDFKIRARDGTIHWVFESAVELRDEHGISHGSIGMYQDITERKQAEEALRAGEQRYRGLFEDSPIAVWEEDLSLIKQRLETLRSQGVSDFRSHFASHPQEVQQCAALVRVVDVNKAALQMYQAHNREEMLKNLQQTINLDPSGNFQDELVNIAEGKTTFHREGTDQTVTGQPIEVNLSWSVAPGYENNYSKVIVSTIDITERKRAEQALQEAKDFAEKVVQTANVMFIQLDTAGNLQKFNSAAEEITGYDLAEVIGKNWGTTLVPRERYPEPWAEFDRLLNKGETAKSFENPILTKQGEERQILWKNSMLYEDNKIVGISSFGIDITERKNAEERIRLQVRQLSALREIDQVINASVDLRVTFDVFLKQTVSQLKVDAAAILLFHPHMLTLEYVAGHGFRSHAIRQARLKLDEGFAGRAVLERHIVHIPDLMRSGGKPAQALLLADEDFNDYYAVPLMAKGQVKGVLELYHRAVLAPDPDWLEFLGTLAGQGAMAIDNAQLFDSLQRSNTDLTSAYDATIEGWSAALDLRDKETEGHSQRVTERTVELARIMGINESELVHIRRGALLHDIGKLGVPDHILLKPGKLTDEEWEIMRKHPIYSYELLSSITYLKPALDIPYCHHEKWDGSGYPRGLKGEQIPLVARIFAVVDVWDALTSDRPYRPAWTKEKSQEYIRAESGKQFDPQVVEAFSRVIVDK